MTDSGMPSSRQDTNPGSPLTSTTRSRAAAAAGRDVETASPRLPRRRDRQERFFLKNAIPWAHALLDTGADVVMTERDGSHGDAFWKEELPLLVAWAFGR